jgi:branched-chain amino acid transport system ATP-binding protein
MNGILKTYNLTKRLDGVVAVNDISISIMEKTITSLIGSNGAGKTTLFNLLTSFMNPDTGEILYKDFKIHNEDKIKLVEKGIGRLWQDIRLFHNMTVFENLLVSSKNNLGENFFNNFIQTKRVKLAEEEVTKKALGVLRFIDLQTHKSNLASTLSYGQQKRLAIGRLLMNDAEVLLLDEPFSGLDMKNVEKFTQLLKNLVAQNKTILMIEHNIEKALELSDWIFRMEAGKIIYSGRPENYNVDAVKIETN